eukprot:CAMPEP_0206464260 /NCGR_PEP_ID=MMETSP0324_2-20121206/27107_1 /ASSEMBLY_ACC=CAM_ASM_000836 /TAXON_ID=2866 /ORGANISM="Crypthecodinium cohnii, Strain Seligo" /LENGTH=117 /DNA_ID=CAMNT_0053936851 /DNA_START=458 /DNA_END=811 /DNA_ORIENTATION=+
MKEKTAGESRNGGTDELGPIGCRSQAQHRAGTSASGSRSKRVDDGGGGKAGAMQCNAMQCSGLSWNWGGGKAAQSCEEWPKDRETVQENETRRRKEGSLEWKNIETRRTTSEPAKTQ